MQVIYYNEEAPTTVNKSIFLAGPSLRPGQKDKLESWRKAAIQILEDKGFDGIVFSPENRDGTLNELDYDDTIEWEDKHLNMADCILFWIPRDLKTLPGFTTNDEWGFWKASGKVVLGAPVDAPKVSYQKFYALRLKVPFSHSLSETVQNAIEKVEALK